MLHLPFRMVIFCVDFRCKYCQTVKEKQSFNRVGSKIGSFSGYIDLTGDFID